MNIVRADTTEQFVRTAAQWISSAIIRTVDEKGSAVVGLSGGSTPQPVYTMLAADQHVPWDVVTFFLTDERYVPSGHADSNQAMIRRTLLTRHAANATLLAPDTSLPLSACIAGYDAAVKDLGHPDLVILGMGDDAHIASLFPPVPPEAFGPAHVIHTRTDRFAVQDRISLTFPALLSAHSRLFLIGGKKKSDLLRTIEQAAEDVSLYPAQYLNDERTTWIVGP
jgi:6-phosphogluconolactonase